MPAVNNMNQNIYTNEPYSASEIEEILLDRKRMSETIKTMPEQELMLVLSMMLDYEEELPDFFFRGCDTCIRENPKLKDMFVDGRCFCHTISRYLCREKFAEYCNKISDDTGISYGQKMREWLAEDIMSCCDSKYLDYTDAIPLEE